MRTVFAFIFWVVSVSAATLSSDGSRADVASKISSAVDGDVVTIPSGDYTWASGVTISGKGIHLQGAGSGRVIARSTSSVSVGTGTKVFTITLDNISQTAATITAGDTLKIWRTGGEVVGGNATGNIPWMRGTVTSLVGTTLTMDITSTNYSGTHGVWIIATEPTALTTITVGTTSDLISITPDTTHSTEISGIRFICAENGESGQHIIKSGYASGAKPLLVHDCLFQMVNGVDCGGVLTENNRGVVWNCSFISTVFSGSALGVVAKYSSANIGSWSSASTMGTSDSDGLSNFYVENCDFHAYINATDWDDQSRVVTRYCLFNNAGAGSHGCDSSPIGVRHWEFYNSTWLFNGFSDGTTLNTQWHLCLRGGTGIVTDCAFDDMNSQDYGNRGELNFGVWILGQGINYGAGDGGTPDYPAPRQFGFGYVTGTPAGSPYNSIYYGDAEPAYVWSNTGTYAVQLNGGFVGGEADPDSIADYIQSSRDYITSAKSGYAKYTYPHPLRTDGGGGGVGGGLTIGTLSVTTLRVE